MSTDYRYVRFFKDVGIDDVASVGGKNASLGEMYRELTPQGVRVPNGFAITAQAYWYVLEKAGIAKRLRETLDGLRPDDVEDLAQRGDRGARVGHPGCRRRGQCHVGAQRWRDRHRILCRRRYRQSVPWRDPV